MGALLFENRDACGRPAVHALIIGVGGYPFLPKSGTPSAARVAPAAPPTLGLVQLESATQGAFAFAKRLIALGNPDRVVEHGRREPTLSLPLGSVRVLLTPTEADVAACKELAEFPPATLENLQAAAYAWREEARRYADSITIFYFSGHGVQRRLGDHVLLLHDFGRPTPRLLESAVSVDNLLNGMRPSISGRNIARRQLTLLDACRAQPAAFAQFEEVAPGSLWDIPKEADEGMDPRVCPLVHSTRPGHLAFGAGDRSFFCEALLRCFAGDAAIPPAIRRLDNVAQEWRITFESLHRALKDLVVSISSEQGEEQTITAQFLGRDFDLVLFPEPPAIDLVLTLHPPTARDCTGFAFSTGHADQVLKIGPPITDPNKAKIIAGEYIVTVSTGDTFIPPSPRILPFLPPRAELPVRLQLRK